MVETDQDMNKTLSELDQSSGDNTRVSSSQKKSADTNLQIPEQRRKKQDVLDGKEKKDSHGHLESEEEGEKSEGNHKSEDKEGKERSKGGDTSTNFSQDEQQQRIIQFSSGGGLGNLGALMGLFVTSAGFRIEASFGFTLNATNTKVSLDFSSTTSNRPDFSGIQAQVVAGTSVNEHLPEGSKTQNYTDITVITSHVAEIQAPALGITQNINNNDNNQGDTSSITPLVQIPLTVGTIAYIPIFNVSNFLFQPQTQFAFSSGTGSAPPSTYSLNNYFNNAGLDISLKGYTLINPSQNLPGGVTYSLSSMQGEQIATFSTTLSNQGFLTSTPILSITLTDPSATSIAQSDAGNMVITAPAPVSLVIDVQSGNGLILPLRLDLGSGTYITNNTENPDSIITYDLTINRVVVEGSTTSSSVISIVNFADEASTLPIIGNIGSFTDTLGANASYTLPANVLFWHVGNSLTNPTPSPGVYGNFETGQITLAGGNTVNLGGNVLDAFGGSTGLGKYGIGQELNLVDGGNSLNTINFGESSTGVSLAVPPGNTLAGFGTGYGDFQTLNLNYSTSSTPAEMEVNFIGNTLAVDKAANSTLYPDIQNLDINVASSKTPVTGLSIVFATDNNGIIVGSSLQGNGANNIYYGDIQNFGDLGNPTLYNGFINGVSVVTSNTNPLTNTLIPSSVVAVEDSNGNIIEFSNDTYTGGSSQQGSGSTETPTNTYNFTLLGSTTNQPIMEGNALITNYNPTTDRFVFQLTPNLFQALDGLDGVYTKTVSVADLMKEVTHTTVLSAATDPAWNTLIIPSLVGTVLDFSGGGSITLENLTAINGEPITLADLNISFQINYSYQPIVAITPTSIPLFGNGGAAQSNNFALDQFFSNSIFANYSVSTALPSGVGIDQYGNITVTNHDAFLGNLTITATDVPNTTFNISTSQTPYTASTALFVGLLDAPETIVNPGNMGITVETSPTTSFTQSASAPVIGANASNIIDDFASGGIIIGSLGNTPDSSGNANANLNIQISQADSNTNYGGDLIVDTAGNSTAYGTSENITIFDQLTIVNGIPQNQTITGQSLTFNGNALDIFGIGYGVSNNFDLTVQGPEKQSIALSPGTLNDSSQFMSNTITIHPQTIYGDGVLYGDANALNINLIGGSNNFLTGLQTLQDGTNLNVSATVTGNTFMIDGVTIQVQGDNSSTLTTIYPNFASLNISLNPIFEKVISLQVQTTSSASFSSNGFIFGNDILIGGQGSTTFEDMNFNTLSLVHNGFNGLVTLGTNPNNVITYDASGNFIEWGNNLYTGGVGQNIYNFTVLENAAGTFTTTPSQDTYAVFTGNDTITNFRIGTDVITLNLEANLYNQLVQIVQQNLNFNATGGALLDLAGVAQFSQSGGNTTITFGTATDPLGTLILDKVSISNFEALGSSLIVNEITPPTYVAPTFNPQATFDPVFINLAQPQAFEGLINTKTTNLLNLNYEAIGFPSGVSLSLDGTLTTSVTAPVAAEITITAIDPITGDRTTAANPELLFFSNASQIIYDTNSGPSSTFSGSGTTAGAYEVEDATVYGTGSSNIDLSGGGVTEQSQLIYDKGIGSAHTIYGDTQYIGDAMSLGSATPGASITGQTYTFDGILLDINIGMSGQDSIYGNAQEFKIAPTGSGSFGGSTASLGNTINYVSNIIYGTGTDYGNLQVLDLDASNDTATISHNTFNFAGNELTSGVSLNGSSTLIPDTATTNLYADIGTLEISGNVTNNALIFGNSTLAGVGPTNFYADIANLSQTDFVTAVTENNTPSGQVMVTDQGQNTITFGNDMFIEGTGNNTYTFTVMTQVQVPQGPNPSYIPIFEGNDMIQGFKPAADTLVLNIAAPLYNQLVQNNTPAQGYTLAASQLDSATGMTLSYDGPNSTLTFSGGGSLTFDQLDLINIFNITPSNPFNLGDFQNINLNYVYYPTAITTNALSPQILIFNGSNTYYSEFYPYFNNLNIENSDTTYSIATALSEISFPHNSGLGLFVTPSATGTPVLELVNVGVNDVNFSTNAPTVTTLVAFFDGTTASNPGTGTIIGNAFGGAGELLEGKANYTLQGNAGNNFSLTTLEVNNTTSDTSTSTQSMGGDNLFIDTFGSSNTAYGNFQSIIYTNNNTATSAMELDTENQTYNYGSNAFNVNGTVYGAAQCFQWTITGGSNILDSSSTADSANAVVSQNALNFGNEAIFGNGTLYQDLKSLSIVLEGGQNDAENGTGSLTAQAIFENNTFSFGTNQVVVYGDTSNEATIIYPDLQSLSITTQAPFEKISAVDTPINTTTFMDNKFIFGDTTVIGGQGSDTIYADANLNNFSANAYNGFVSPISVDGSTGFIVTTTTDGLSNQITWGNDTFVGSAKTNTYNFTLLENAAGTYTAGTAGTPNIPGQDTHAVFTGNDTITNFRIGTDVITLNLEPNLYNKIVQAVEQNFGYTSSNLPSGGALLDLAGIAEFTSTPGGSTTITFGTATDPLGTLILDGLSISNFEALGSISLVVNEISNPNYIAPSLNTSPSFDPVFLNNTSQPGAFEGLIASNTSNLLSLTYSVAETSPLPTGVTLSSNGTLNVSNITAPEVLSVTLTAEDPTTGDSVNLPPTLFFISNASQIIYDSNSGSSNTFNGSGTTPGAYEVEDATVYGKGSSTIDLAGSGVTEQSQLIYDTGTGSAHTIYGDAEEIDFGTPGAPITSQTYTFDTVLLDINIGASGQDSIYGNAQEFKIAPTGSGSFGGSTASLGNTINYVSNIIYGTGTDYGNLQVLDLDARNGTATISHNTFNFAGNELTSGVSLNGSSTLIPDTATTNLYADIGKLEICGNVTNNALIFGNSTLTGVGPTNFYADIANLSQTDFVSAVTETNSEYNQVVVTDQLGNSITFGNDMFIEKTVNNTYNFIIMAQTVVSGSSTTYTPIFEGNDTIQGFNPSMDTLVLNIASPLYNQYATASNGNPAITVTELNTVSSTTSTSADFYFDYNSSTRNTTIFMNGGGSLIIDGQDISNFSQFTNLTINYIYFDPPITTYAAPTQPLLFHGNNTDYSVFAPYFNNVDIENPNTTYTITSAIPDVSLPEASGVSLWAIPAATGTPLLELVNVGMNDVNDATNHPSITTLVGYFDGAEAAQNGYSMIGNAVGGAGELFQGTANDVLQGNAGNGQTQTQYSTEVNDSTTSAVTQNIAGDNLFIDTTGSNTAYGDFESVVYTYQNTSSTSPTELSIQNQTYNYATNAFDVNGTSYGVSDTFQINVIGDSNLTSTNSGVLHAGTLVSDNTYNFANQTIFGSGTAYGDFNTLTINLEAGSNNSESGTGALSVSADFDHNTINIGSNLIDMIGTGTNNVLYGNVDSIVINEQPGTNNTGSVAAGTSFEGNTIVFGDDTLIGGAGTNDFIGHAQNFALQANIVNDPDYGGASFYNGDVVNITTNAQGEEVVSITDQAQNTITWGNDTYTGGTSGVNTYNFTIVGTEGENPQAVMQGFDTVTNFNINTDKLSFALTNSLYQALDGYKGTSLTTSQLFGSNGITITQNSSAAILNFAGGGSITLDGYGTSSSYTPQTLEAALIKNNDISVSNINPVSTLTTSTIGISSLAAAAALVTAVTSTIQDTEATSPHQPRDTASPLSSDHPVKSYNVWGSDIFEHMVQSKYDIQSDLAKVSEANNSHNSHEYHASANGSAHISQHSIEASDAHLANFTTVDPQQGLDLSHAELALKISEAKWGNLPLVQKLTEGREVDINKMVADAKTKLGQTNGNGDSVNSLQTPNSLSQIDEGHHHINYGLTPEASQMLLEAFHKYGPLSMHDFGIMHYDQIDVLNPFHHFIPHTHH